MPARKRQPRRSWGAIRKLPSGRHQATYRAPNGRRYPAPHTFDTKGDADAWLAAQRTDIARDEWEKPAPKRPAAQTFAAYSADWLATRDLTGRTRTEYQKLLTSHLLGAFGAERLDEITPAAVRTWHAGLARSTGPTRRAHAYGLLKAIMATAVTDDLVPSNPCRIRGASKNTRARAIRPATLAELRDIADAMPERWRMAVLLAAWCGLRFGEMAELRRKDVDLEHGRLRIRRGVTYVKGMGDVVGAPKSEAGVRDVTIPPHLLTELKAHMLTHAQRGRDGLLFYSATGGHLRTSSSMHKAFHEARAKAGRPDLTFHDLRHTGATLAAAAGATVAELMVRIGHATPDMAMRYQHATAERDQAIAQALSEFHEANVVKLRPRTPSAANNGGRKGK
jgi:integrase